MSQQPTNPPTKGRVWDDPRIVAPDEAAWAEMSPAEREAAVEEIVAVLDESLNAMSEGTPHFRNKSGAAADLDGHFRRAGRKVFLACELAVIYPGEPALVPDVLAVLDCDPDLDLGSWVVATQRRGIDVAIEVRNTGAKHKDLVENVRDYARVGIPEYFSFDCRSATLRGWRLGAPDARTYLSLSVLGSLPSVGAVCSSSRSSCADSRASLNQALVPSASELVSRLQAMTDESQRAALESQLAALESERTALESRRAASEAEARAAKLRATVAASIVRLCDRQGVALDDAQRAMIAAERDADRLTRWFDRCLDASTAAEIFVDDRPSA
ncbi:MAG: Uma2 family endonuclease [Deltaproteobacteria bacterium]|nr:Uma2 family endonuclease [Deltaproteobacteria bacterium]